MKRITFNTETIEDIRKFISEGHTISETCNKFTLKEDTLRRVMYENNIEAYHKEKRSTVKSIDECLINQVCSLYATTDIPMDSICKEVKLENYIVRDILSKHFTESYMNSRKSKLYRLSKLRDKNLAEGTCRYLGYTVSGGDYVYVKKPDWYTGRVKSDTVFLHTVVMCEALGITEIPKGYVVHHIDYNRQNNDVSNLALMTLSAHGKLHSIESKMCKAQRLSTTE